MTKQRRAPGFLARAGILAVAIGSVGGAAAETPERERLPADRNGVELSVVRAGDQDGFPVVLIHGTPGSTSVWSEFLDAPRSGFRLHAIDRPGFGETLPQEVETRLERQSSALEPLLAEAPAILVGHSLGGAVVLDAAARYPDRVAGVVVAAGALDPAQEDVWAIQHMGRWRLIEWMLPSMLRNANIELIEFEAELRALEPRLAEVRSPVVIVHGTEDRQVPFANVAFMQRVLEPAASSVETVRLDGADHFLPWKHTDVLWDAIDRLARPQRP
jgi:pimeloyl-ACP methyl ester carboxylesterase